MAEGNGRAWSSEVKDLGDKIVALTVTKAVELSEYMEEVHKIKPAAAGVAVMPGGGGGAAVQREDPVPVAAVRHRGLATLRRSVLKNASAKRR